MPAAEPLVLVVTPVKNARKWLPRYFELLEGLAYDPEKLSLGLLDSDSDDGTYEAILDRLPALRRRYRRAEVVKHDYGLRLPGPRWTLAAQPLRRQVLSRARNRLLSHALRDEAWVLWLDVDLIEYPSYLLARLLAVGKDIIVPHCVRPNGNTYDLNTFRFDPRRGAPEDPSYLIDGYYFPPRGVGRAYLDALVPESLVTVDGVGGTALLIRADLHRDGLIFPAYSHRGYVETEGLAMMAKDMGYECWAMPNLYITHRWG
jgi:glycosyltransferase involved in cell wall biosynthesis